MSDFDPDYWGARIRAAAQVVPKGEAVMPVMAQVPKDSPLMIAWESHKQTEEYANAKMWASYPQHVDGSLWALFEAGWRAAHLTQPAQAVDVGKVRQALTRMQVFVDVSVPLPADQASLVYELLTAALPNANGEEDTDAAR